MPSLFTLSTDRLNLTWDGSPAPSDSSAPPGYLRVQPLRSGIVPRVEVGGEPVEADYPLRLAEQTAYRVFVRARNGAPVTFRHDDPLVLRALVANDDGDVLSGTVDFAGQVGRSRFVALVGGEEEVAFEVEVFPTKATFEEVEAMRVDLDEALAGLAFEYLRATTAPTGPIADPPPRSTWLILLRRVLPDLEASLARVAMRPHRDLERSPHFVRAERVRRPDATLKRAVLRGYGRGEKARLQSGSSIHAMLPERKALDTLDTSEHRWIRQRLERARAVLAAAQRDETRLPRSVRRRKVLGDLADAERRVARLLRNEPLRAASVSEFVSTPTHRLVTASGYAEAYQALQRLSLSLSLAGGPVPHATRDLHHLYEMWCYLAVLREVARVLDQAIPPASFFRAEHLGVRLLLRRGHRHRVAFESGARKVRVTYNPRFSAHAGLLNQRPDLLLTIEGSTTRRFVLDAKYRRDDSTRYQQRFGAPGPPEDALGDLHRYRDAIRDRRGERIIEQAVALYPHRAGDGFAESRLWSAIVRVGVGAIPVVPGATRHLTRWLEEVLAD